MPVVNRHDYAIAQLDERIKLLEEKLSRRSRKTDTDRAQQMLILKHLGFLDQINTLKINKNKKALLLSVLLNADANNIEKDLTNIFTKQNGKENSKNYRFLVDLFEKTDLKKEQKEAEKILMQIEKGNPS